MLTYPTLQDRPREFLAATGLTHAEFARLLPAFATAYAALSPPDKTLEGKRRQRRVGGGAPGALPPREDKRLFILVSQRTKPLQTMHGCPCDLSQPQTTHGMHHVLPVLPRAFVALDVAPDRNASRGAPSLLALEGAPNWALDGTERRRHRPQEAIAHTEHDSGQKKAHTDKNLRLVYENTGKVSDLGPTIAGKTHDTKAADAASITSPGNATRAQDTGLQGYEPAGILSAQPKKSRKARHGAWGSSASITSSPVPVWWWKM